MSISDPILVYVSDLPKGFCTGSGVVGFLGMWRGVRVISFSGFLQSPAHAAGCSNSSDTHAQERRFSAAWSLTESDCT